MKKNHLDEFEKKVLSGLKLCGIEVEKINEKNHLGAAVSGGADSVSLLFSLSRILDFYGKKNFLEVITVNHKIREKSETDGDATFVENLCKKFDICCTTVIFEDGEVAQNAMKRKKGTEEAAREMRYAAFKDFINKKSLSYLCLAHNQNDQTETILMRILNGSGSEGLGGIPRTRDKFARPLLEISRTEIENYLIKNQINWRTDKTNFDNHYSRNKIRNVLVPFLNENFSGWKSQILSFARKSFDDNSFIQKNVERILADSARMRADKKNGQKYAEIDAKIFYQLDLALKRRIIYGVLNKLGFGERFPFKLVEEICGWKWTAVKPAKMSEKQKYQKILNYENLKITLEDENLKFEKFGEDEKSPQKILSSGYQFVFSDKNDFFKAEEMKFHIKEKNERTFLCVENKESKSELEISLPFFVGSVMSGEKIKSSDGKSKKINDIFSDWKVPEAERNLIPVAREISSGIEAKAVLGSLFGFSDWKVMSK